MSQATSEWPVDDEAEAEWLDYLQARRQELTAAGWNEADHPRHPGGSPEGGRFAPKGEEVLGSDRDPQWAGDPIHPKDAEFTGMFGGGDARIYSAMDNSTRVWDGHTNPEMQYSLDTDYYRETVDQQYANRDRPLSMPSAEWDKQLAAYHDTLEVQMRTIGEEGDLRIQTPLDFVDSILDDGRFKSQFEVPYSQGAFSPTVRGVQEEMFFGYPQDMPPENRPIYGWLDHPDGEITREHMAGGQYGEVTWLLKPELKDRTTISFMDSLSRPVVPGPIRNPGWRATVPPGYEDNGMSGATPMISDHNYETGLFDEVMETQYHGGVTLDDVAGMRVTVASYGSWEPQDFAKLRSIRERLSGHNIPFEAVDEWGDPVDIDSR